MKNPFFKVGDKVTYKSELQCTDQYNKPGYWFGGVDQENIVGEIEQIYEFVPEKNCYEIYVTSSDEFPYAMLECEFLEYEETSNKSEFPKLIQHTEFGDLMDYGDNEPHCVECCQRTQDWNTHQKLRELCTQKASYYFVESTKETEQLPTKSYPDISNILTKFDHFFQVKSPLTDLFQQFIEEIMGIDTFLAEVDIDYIREADFDITNLKDTFINIRASLFIDIPFYEDFEITEKAEDLWDNLLTQYKIHDDAKIEHNRYQELLPKPKLEPIFNYPQEEMIKSLKEETAIPKQTNKKLFKF